MNCNGMIALADALAQQRKLASKKLWRNTTVRNTPYIFRPTVAAQLDHPYLVVPANPRRVSLVMGQVVDAEVTNEIHQFYYSFGYPAVKPLYGVFPGASYGLPIPGILMWLGQTPIITGPLGNGTVSVDEIWVGLACGGGPPPLHAVYCIIYEGVLSVENDANPMAA